jgi:hypothetical protein
MTSAQSQERIPDEVKNEFRGIFSRLNSHAFGQNGSQGTSSAVAALTRAMFQARLKLSPDQYSEYLNWVHRQLNTTAPTLRNRFLTFEQQGFLPSKTKLTLERELDWAAQRLARHTELLSSFRKMADEFEATFLRAQSENVFELLNSMHSEFGDTFWFIEAKIFSEQVFNDLESQKVWTDKIKSRARRKVAGFFAHYVSIRNEFAVNSNRYRSNIRAYVSQLKIDNSFKILLLERLIGEAPSTATGLSSLLKLSNNLHHIDLYESLISAIQTITSTPNLTGLRPSIEPVLDKLSSIDDFRLRRIRTVLDGDPKLLGNRVRDYSSLRLLVGGDARQALRASHSNFKMNPTDLVGIQVAALSLSASEKPLSIRDTNSFFGFLARRLSVIYSKKGDLETALDEVDKLALNLRFTSFGSQLQKHVNDKCGILNWFQHDSALSETVHDPLLGLNDLMWISEQGRDDYQRFLVEQSTGQSVAELFGYVLGWTDKIKLGPSELYKVAEVVRQFLREGPAEGLKALSNIQEEIKAPYFRSNLALWKIQMLHTIGATQELIDEIAKFFVSNTTTEAILPIEGIFIDWNWNELKPFEACIGLPIVLDIHFEKTGDDKLATLRHFAVRRFLSAHNMRKPSDVAAHTDDFPIKELIYFLKHICVSNVLDMVPALKSTRDIDDERIAICELLTKIDPANASDYQREVISLSNDIRVQEGLKVVDQSRIHVDEAALTRWALQELEEDFNRYRDYIKVGIGTGDDMDSIIRSLMQRDPDSENYFKVPDNEADDILIQMVQQLRNQFLNNTTYGLDSFLSSRIRHGSMSGYLRSPVESRQLVTQRKSAQGPYEKNQFWLNKFTTLNQHQLSLIEDAFDEFTRSFDAIILDLKDVRFHIKSKSNPDGLFDIPILATQLHLLRSVSQNITDFREFLTSCYGIFWGVLGQILDQTKVFLATEVKTKYSSLFDELRKSLSDHCRNDPAFAELSRALVEASAEVQAEIERLQGWINRTEIQQVHERYPIAEALDIGIQSTLKMHRAIEPDIDIQCADNITVDAGSLINIADVLRIALGNAFEHSGKGRKVNVSIECEFDAQKQILVLRFSNPVAKGVNCDQNQKVLAKTSSLIESGSYREKVRTEGGSGLLKLANLIYQSKRGTLDFILGDDEFTLLVGVPMIITSKISE